MGDTPFPGFTKCPHPPASRLLPPALGPEGITQPCRHVLGSQGACKSNPGRRATGTRPQLGPLGERALKTGSVAAVTGLRHPAGLSRPVRGRAGSAVWLLTRQGSAEVRQGPLSHTGLRCTAMCTGVAPATPPTRFFQPCVNRALNRRMQQHTPASPGGPTLTPGSSLRPMATHRESTQGRRWSGASLTIFTCFLFLLTFFLSPTTVLLLQAPTHPCCKHRIDEGPASALPVRQSCALWSRYQPSSTQGNWAARRQHWAAPILCAPQGADWEQPSHWLDSPLTPASLTQPLRSVRILPRVRGCCGLVEGVGGCALPGMGVNRRAGARAEPRGTTGAGALSGDGGWSAPRGAGGRAGLPARTSGWVPAPRDPAPSRWVPAPAAASPPPGAVRWGRCGV